MLPSDFVISDCEVWSSNGVQKSVDVFVASGSVDEIVPHGAREHPDAVIEAKGQALLPSGLDLQVHIRSPGQYHKENPTSAARAALRGGYAYMLAMPNTFPTVDTPERMARVLWEYEKAERQCGVVFSQSSAMTEGLAGEVLVDFPAMRKAGASSFTDDGVPLVNDELMLKAFQECEKLDTLLLQHAEWPGHGGALCKGRTQTKLNIPEYPRDAESRLVKRDLGLLKKVPSARYHVLHVTTKASVEAIRIAKNEGLRVSAEVSPHHLYFCNDDIPEDNSSFKMNPPLFTSEDREALRQALSEGLFSFVATDHAPHEAWAKAKGFEQAPFGTTGLETSLRVLLKMLHLGVIKNEAQLVELFSSGAARQMRIESDGWGDVKAGTPLRAVLFDHRAEERPVEEGELESLSKNNLFVGTSLPGRVTSHFTPAGHFCF